MRLQPNQYKTRYLLGRLSGWFGCLALIVLVIASNVRPSAAQNPTPSPPPQTSDNAPVITLTVSGTVSSSTAGVPIPAGLIITLNVAHTDNTLKTKTVKRQMPLNADNTFRFESVSAQVGDAVFLTTTFDGVLQGSPVITVDAPHPTLELPITLYAATHDSSVISLFKVQQILDFDAGFMQVLSSYQYKNTSDRLYFSNDKTKQGAPISVVIPLPVGAGRAAFPQSPDRFVIGGETYSPIVQDTRPVLPGQVDEIVFSYTLPYEFGATIDQDYPYNTSALELLIPKDTNVRLVGDFDTKQTTLPSNPDRKYTQYTLRKPLSAGGRLVYTLQGGQSTPTPRPPPEKQSPEILGELPIGECLLFMGVLAIIGGVSFMLRRPAIKAQPKRPTPPTKS